MVVGGGGILSGSPSSKGAMVVIQDADGDIFGAWIGEGIHLSHGSYYGGGDSCGKSFPLPRIYLQILYI